MKSSFKIALLVAYLVSLAGLFIGLYMFNLETEDLLRVRPDFKLTASVLQKAFETDETAANHTYLNKIIEVTGIVESVRPGEGKALNVSLKTENPVSVVSCSLQSVSDPSEFKPGEQITIRGECSGFLMDILLNKCVVVR